MAAAILRSFKQGAYTAVAGYVVFIAVVTAASVTSPLIAGTARSSVVPSDHVSVDTKGRVS